jgi:two-component system sensor histidine kinase YesM
MWRMVKIRKSLSLYTRLLIFFVVTLVPLYVLSFILNDLSIAGINDQKLETLSIQVDYALRQLEDEIERIVSVQSLYADYEGSLVDFSSRMHVMTPYELGQTASVLYNRLVIMKYTSDLIQDVTVYAPKMHAAVSTSGYYRDEFTDEEMKLYRKRKKPGSGVFDFHDGRLYMILNYPVTGQQREPLCNVIVELSEAAVKRMFDQFGPEGNAALIGSDWFISGDDSMFTSLYETAVERRVGSDTGKVEKVEKDGEQYLVSYQTSSFLNASLFVYVPEKSVLGNLGKYRMLLVLLLAASIVIVLVFSYGLSKMIRKPLRSLVRLFMEVERGNLNVAVHYGKDDEFGYLFRGFRKMLGEIHRLIDETFVQKIRLKQAELKHLQAQISPHFLYNSFYILRQSVRYQDYDTAEEMAKHLGDYLKFITRNDKDDVSLAFEYQHARTYLEIQRIRYQQRVSIHVDPLPEAYAGIMVPRLILQPLIENAYKYGMSQLYEGGRVGLFIRPEDSSLLIAIEDNGPGMPEDELAQLQARLEDKEEYEETTGLINIHRRLRLRFGEEGGITAEHPETGGFRVTIRIPQQRNGDSHVQTDDR